jgi:hypothetical protein
MKPWLSFGLFSATALCTLVSPVRADALDKSRVPAQARWVAHVDVEALTHSTLFAAMKAQHGKDFELDGDLAELESEFGIDPFVDLKSLTVYCAEKSPERSVILMSGSEKLDAALTRLQEQPGYRTEKESGHTLHVWSQGDETWYGWVLRRDSSANRVVVLSGNRDDLLNGVAVVRGHEAQPGGATRRARVRIARAGLDPLRGRDREPDGAEPDRGHVARVQAGADDVARRRRGNAARSTRTRSSTRRRPRTRSRSSRCCRARSRWSA